jgi:TatD DNase family protein
MHCHLDRYPNPRQIAEEADKAGVAIVAVTNLPSHFAAGKEPASRLKNVRLSLGLHPMLAPHSQRELELFAQLMPTTTYIGEVGLDFSKDGIGTKEKQVDTFRFVLERIAGKGKVLSLHSRKAEVEVLSCLRDHAIAGATFHWYTGTKEVLARILDAGHFLSINSAMLKSNAGRDLIAGVPPSCCLLETDGPYTRVGRFPSRPVHLHQVVEQLSRLWSLSIDATQELIGDNFRKMLQRSNEGLRDAGRA